MHRLLLVAPAVLTACTTPAATQPASCSAAGAEHFVGMPGTPETGAAIMKATGAAVLRWAPPGYTMTMEYRADRVTVRLGPDGKVTAINCG